MMSDEAAMLLERHYEKCRSAQSSTIPVTVRFLESLIRLSQAHARLMFRGVVTLDDAVAVIRVMECSAFTYGGFDSNVGDYENVLYCDPMTIDFSSHADQDFLCFKSKIVHLYGMLSYLSPEEQRQINDALNNAYSDPYAANASNDTNASASDDWSGRETERDRYMHRDASNFPDPKRRRR